MYAKVSEKDHVIDHEAEERSNFVLRWQHELLRLVFDNCSDLLFHLTGLLQDKVHPWELFFNAIVKVGKLGSVRVSVEDVDREPASCIELNDLQWTPTR